MRVLLCSPIGEGNVFGGIAIWGRNLLDFYHTTGYHDVHLDAVSFDRQYDAITTSNIFQRVLQGIKEYRKAIRQAIYIMDNQGPYDVMHLCSSASISLLKDWYLLRKANHHGVRTCLHLRFGRVPELAQKNNWEWKILKRVAKLSDKVIAIDKRTYTTFVDHGFNNICLLPNPLFEHVLSYITSEQSKIKRQQNKVVFVGHVIETKGVFELIEAYNALSGMELHLIGPISEETKQRIKNLVLNPAHLHIYGGIPHKEVIREMLSASLFVLPSYSEGFPNVILEAMACGCPIVATQVGAIPEMLEEEDGKQYGIIVQPQSTHQLQEAIHRMLNCDSLREECGRNARLRVHERYTMAQVWQQLIKIWQNKSENL